SRKESIQRKGGPITASSLRFSVLSGVSREGFLPFYALWVPADARHPCHALYALGCFGLIPTKPAVLGAANGKQKTLLRNVS
ncbi:MAG: hypothetical protein PHU14_16100, partial [Methylovulum sp.]|nr:hypothetical protein [Methylovulum sp.]